MRKLLTLFGTRPEAIKMCPLVLELKKSPSFENITVVTGQHREMLDQILDCFEISPEYDLHIMKPGQTLFDITISIMEKMQAILKKENPDMVLVHGDTTTAFAGALSAFYMGIPVGHVEAGLRTYQNWSPFPEEFNRQAVGSMASLHFAPTEKAVQHLKDEHKDPDAIFLTGNTVIDALNTTVRKNFTHPILNWSDGRRLVLLTAHRRENLEKLKDMFRGIRRALAERKDVCLVYPVHKNPLVRQAAEEVFGGREDILLCEPLDVLEFHNIMARSYLILTDSGGIQEEAPALGKPVLVMRDTTERPEGIRAGTLRLAGTSEGDIYRHLTELLDNRAVYEKMQKAVNPYGDGKACKRIVKILERK